MRGGFWLYMSFVFIFVLGDVEYNLVLVRVGLFCDCLFKFIIQWITYSTLIGVDDCGIAFDNIRTVLANIIDICADIISTVVNRTAYNTLFAIIVVILAINVIIFFTVPINVGIVIINALVLVEDRLSWTLRASTVAISVIVLLVVIFVDSYYVIISSIISIVTEIMSTT